MIQPGGFLLLAFLVGVNCLTSVYWDESKGLPGYQVVSVSGQTGQVKILSNFSLSDTNVGSVFDDTFGTTCDTANNIMMVGAGFGKWNGPSGSGAQQIVVINQKNGDILNQIQMKEPKTSVWCKALHYSVTHQSMYILAATNNWDPTKPQRMILGRLQLDGSLEELNSFDPKAFPGSNLLLDKATTFDETEGFFIGVSIHNNATVSLWKLGIKGQPISFVPVLYQGQPFQGRLWGFKYTRETIICNSEHVANHSLLQIGVNNGMISPIDDYPSSLQLTNWEPALVGSMVYTYGSGSMFHKSLVRLSRNSGRYSITQMTGLQYKDQPIKGFCPMID